MSATRNAQEPTEPRPLTARSLIASLLLGLDPPRSTAQFIVRSNELFGVHEGTTRTALSRMVATGELTSSDRTYELGGDLRDRQSRQAESRRAERQEWDGTWILEVIDREARTAGQRASFREAAKRLRLVEWREGVWCRPDNLDPHRLAASRAVVAAQSSTVRGAVLDEPPLADFMADAWAAEAERLIGRMGDLRDALVSGSTEALRPGFVLSADVIRHFGSDPLLPDDLVDDSWPGRELRVAFSRHDAAFARAHRAWFSPE